MAEVEQGRFPCAGCGKQYRWKPELAGKKAKCKCGTVMSVPREAPGGGRDEFDDLYALAPEDGPPKQPQATATAAVPVAGIASVGQDNQYRCPSCKNGLQPGAVICTHCGFNLREGKKVAAASSGPPRIAGMPVMPSRAGGAGGGAAVLGYRGGPTPREKAEAADNDLMFEGSITKNLYLPIGLIIVGLIIQYGQVLYWSEEVVEGLAAATVYVGVTVFINAFVMLIGILVAAKALGIGFGPVWTAILKLVAIAIAPGAIGDIISIAMGEGFVALITGGFVSLALYWALFSLLFDLDFSETINCVMIIWAVRWVTGCLLMGAIMSFLFSGGGGG